VFPIFLQAGLGLPSSYPCLLNSWDDRHSPQCLARWILLVFPGLVLNLRPPNLHLLSNWDYSSEPWHPASLLLLQNMWLLSGVEEKVWPKW
jgi:hypothetical protein